MDELLKQLAAIDAKIDAILAADELTDEKRAELTSLEDQRLKAEEKIELAKKQQARVAQRASLEADAAQQKAQLQADAERRRIEEERAKRTAPASNRLTQPDLPGQTHTLSIPAVPRDLKAEGMWDFRSFTHFAESVRDTSLRKRETPEISHLMNLEPARAVATGLGESLGSEAGYLVPPTFAAKIFSRVYGPNTILGMTDQYTLPGNQISFPRNLESSRANGSRSGGVDSYWRDEGASPTASKPKFGKFTLTLHKLIAMARVTDELRSDAGPALEQYLERAFSDEINFKVGDAIFNGTGAGMPLGLLTSPAKVSVSKESGQAAATLNAQNIVKMRARLWSGCRAGAAWFINQDVEPQLHLMTLGIGTAGVVTYMPPGGLSGNPFATLMGAPVIPTEFNQTLGTEGDIVLADLSHYATAMKGGPEMAWSMHLYFDTDEQAFRITFRIDGAPWWASALTPAKGSAAQSCIVTLATRS